MEYFSAVPKARWLVGLSFTMLVFTKYQKTYLLCLRGGQHHILYQMLEKKFQTFSITENFSLGDKHLLPTGQLLQV